MVNGDMEKNALPGRPSAKMTTAPTWPEALQLLCHDVAKQYLNGKKKMQRNEITAWVRAIRFPSLKEATGVLTVRIPAGPATLTGLQVCTQEPPQPHL